MQTFRLNPDAQFDQGSKIACTVLCHESPQQWRGVRMGCQSGALLAFTASKLTQLQNKLEFIFLPES